jgi:putative nucleotidyltransferase with HDIG domain
MSVVFSFPDGKRLTLDDIISIPGRSFGDFLSLLTKLELDTSPSVASHQKAVADYAAALARDLGIEDKAVRELRFAARYHDIGKLCVPEAVLHKPSRLSAEEMVEMRRHTEHGRALLDKAGAPASLRDVALYHHERYDGCGYYGVKGEDIPFFARIVTIADVFDALTSQRAYKAAMTETEALLLMTKDDPSPGFGRRAFDPIMLRRFVSQRLSLGEFPADAHAALTTFACSDPMDDLPKQGFEGLKLKRSGYRLFYEDQNGRLRLRSISDPANQVRTVAASRHEPIFEVAEPTHRVLG